MYVRLLGHLTHWLKNKFHNPVNFYCGIFFTPKYFCLFITSTFTLLQPCFRMRFEIYEMYFFCQNVFANDEAAEISIENIHKYGENGRGFFYRVI